MNYRHRLAVGQMGLAHAYEKCFAAHDLLVAGLNLLLTHTDLANRERFLRMLVTRFALLKLKSGSHLLTRTILSSPTKLRSGIIDTLGALTTNLVDADILGYFD